MKTRSCQECQTEFTIYDRDLQYYAALDVPPPDTCPLCRHILRNANLNERNIYQRTCDKCKQPTFSVYSKDKPFTVYCRKCWWQDDWDPLIYGQDIDWSRPFFEQFAELRAKVPRIAMGNDADSVNSDFCTCCWRLKNCYLVSDAVDDEDCMYSNGLYQSKDCIDCSYVAEHSQLCYECVFVRDSYNLRYSRNSTKCRDSAFLLDCVGVSNSFMCVGMRTVQYCYKNKPLSKEEYEQVIAKYNLGSRESVRKYQKEFEEFANTIPRRFYQGVRNEDSDGDQINNTKSVHHSFQTWSAEQCSYLYGTFDAKNCYDMMVWGETAELCYEGQTVGGQVYKILFSIDVWGGRENTYCDTCINGAQFCFGCISLKKETHCILNKAYTAKKYERLKAKLIEHMKETGEWGRFFPKALALYSYNESFAQSFVPLTKEQALAQGWTWQDNLPGTFGKETDPAGPPDDISDCTDNSTEVSSAESVTKKIYACADCQRNYKVISEELTLYAQLGIPLPDRCPSCRFSARMRHVPPFQLWKRQCMCIIQEHNHAALCPEQFQTAYSPKRPETVYCAICYNKVVY